MKQVMVMGDVVANRRAERFDARRSVNAGSHIPVEGGPPFWHGAGTMRRLFKQPGPRTAALALVLSLFAHATLASPPATPTIRVVAAWIRWLPAGLPEAGYLTVTNVGGASLALESASSPFYGDVSIHRSITRGTTEEMEPVKEITLAPHQTLEFESTGYHLMLMKPKPSVDATATIPITLVFKDGSSVTVPFEVRKKPQGNAAQPTP
jgi:periplasmic copper chaperone A